MTTLGALQKRYRWLRDNAYSRSSAFENGYHQALLDIAADLELAEDTRGRLQEILDVDQPWLTSREMVRP